MTLLVNLVSRNWSCSRILFMISQKLLTFKSEHFWQVRLVWWLLSWKASFYIFTQTKCGSYLLHACFWRSFIFSLASASETNCGSYLLHACYWRTFNVSYFHSPAHLTQIVGLICYMHATEDVSYFQWPAHLRQIVGLISNLQLSAVKTHRHQDVLLKERVTFSQIQKKIQTDIKTFSPQITTVVNRNYNELKCCFKKFPPKRKHIKTFSIKITRVKVINRNWYDIPLKKSAMLFSKVLKKWFVLQLTSSPCSNLV